MYGTDDQATMRISSSCLTATCLLAALAIPLNSNATPVTEAETNVREIGKSFNSVNTVVDDDVDFDEDGIPNTTDLDDDNDGIPDTVEGTGNSDNDSQPDYQDLDSDNDGIYDIVEVQGEDTNNDGQVDNMLDEDSNGLSDELQIAPYEIVDTDSDLVADFRDVDSDNDGLTDVLESGGIDDDADGRIDGFADINEDGADDATQLGPIPGRDIDGDGEPNRLDLDSDADGITDVVEAGALDNLDDGITDSLQDIDSDGIPDSVDADETAGPDSDLDSIDDFFDADFSSTGDTDTDGIINSDDPDADGDGLADDPQNAPSMGQTLPDLNDNGIEDVYEIRGLIRTGLSGRGCSVNGARYGTSDPVFASLIAAFAILLWRRRRVRR